MSTQKFMGRGQLLQRLTEQMRTQANPPRDPEAAARAVLAARGMLGPTGALTATGQARDRMTAEERAKDRTGRRFGVDPQGLVYDPVTNKARRAR